MNDRRQTLILFGAAMVCVSLSIVLVWKFMEYERIAKRLDDAAEYNIKRYVRSTDRLSRTNIIEWQSAFCAINGLKTVKVPEFEYGNLQDFPPVTREEWDRVVGKMVQSGEIDRMDIPVFRGVYD